MIFCIGLRNFVVMREMHVDVKPQNNSSNEDDVVIYKGKTNTGAINDGDANIGIRAVNKDDTNEGIGAVNKSDEDFANAGVEVVGEGLEENDAVLKDDFN